MFFMLVNLKKCERKANDSMGTWPKLNVKKCSKRYLNVRLSYSLGFLSNKFKSTVFLTNIDYKKWHALHDNGMPISNHMMHFA